MIPRVRIVLDLNLAAGIFDVDTGDTKGRAGITEVADAMPPRVQRAIRQAIAAQAAALTASADDLAADARDARQRERGLRDAITAASAVTDALPNPPADAPTDTPDVTAAPQTPA